MPSAKTQKMASLPAQHGPSLARDALLQAYAPHRFEFGHCLWQEGAGTVDNEQVWLNLLAG